MQKKVIFSSKAFLSKSANEKSLWFEEKVFPHSQHFIFARFSTSLQRIECFVLFTFLKLCDLFLKLHSRNYKNEKKNRKINNNTEMNPMRIYFHYCQRCTRRCSLVEKWIVLAALLSELANSLALAVYFVDLHRAASRASRLSNLRVVRATEWITIVYVTQYQKLYPSVAK